jgi:hypothetical protein
MNHPDMDDSPRPTPVDELRRVVLETVGDIRAFLASPEGRRLRSRVASGLVIAAPALARLPWMRASRLGRLVGMAGGAALIVKLAELIRDWEPERGAGYEPVGP